MRPPSAVETFLQWIAMIPGDKGMLNVKDASVGQVRAYRAELAHRINSLNQMLVAADQLLKYAATAEDNANLYAQVRDKNPEQFDDE